MWEFRYAMNRMRFNKRRSALLLVCPLILVAAFSSISLMSSSSFVSGIRQLDGEILHDYFLSFSKPLSESELQNLKEDTSSITDVVNVETFAILKGSSSIFSYAVCFIPEQSVFWNLLDTNWIGLNGTDAVELLSPLASPKMAKGSNLSIPLAFSSDGSYGSLNLSYTVRDFGEVPYTFEALSCALASVPSGFIEQTPDILLVTTYETAFAEITSFLSSARIPDSRMLFSGIGVSLDSEVVSSHAIDGTFGAYSAAIETSIMGIGSNYGVPDLYRNIDGGIITYQALQNQLALLMIVDSIPFLITILFVVYVINRELQETSNIESMTLKRKGISSDKINRILKIESFVISIASLPLGFILSILILFVMDYFLINWSFYPSTISAPLLVAFFSVILLVQIKLGAHTPERVESYHIKSELPFLSKHRKVMSLFAVLAIYKLLIWAFNVSIISVRYQLVSVIPSAFLQFLTLWATIDNLLTYLAPTMLIVSITYFLSTTKGSSFFSHISSKINSTLSEIASAHQSVNIGRLSALSFCILILTSYGVLVSSNIDGNVFLAKREISAEIGGDLRCLLEVSPSDSMIESIENTQGVESAVLVEEYTMTIDGWVQNVLSVDFSKWYATAYWESDWFELPADSTYLDNQTIILEKKFALQHSIDIDDEITLGSEVYSNNVSMNLVVSGFFGPSPEIQRFSSGEIYYESEDTWSFVSPDAVSSLNLIPRNWYILVKTTDGQNRQKVIEDLNALGVVKTIDSSDFLSYIPLVTLLRLTFQISCLIFLAIISILGLASLIIGILSNIERDLIHMHLRGLSLKSISRIVFSEICPPLLVVAIGVPLGIIASYGSNSPSFIGMAPSLTRYELFIGPLSLLLILSSTMLVVLPVLVASYFFLKKLISFETTKTLDKSME